MIAFLFSPIGKIAGAAGLVLVAFLGFKLWLASHDRAILQGYVARSEKVAAEAETAELRRQLSAGQLVTESYQIQLKNLRAAEEIEDAEADQKEKDYATKLKARSCDGGLTDDDVDYILRR